MPAGGAANGEAALSLTQTVVGPSSGGADALLARPTLAGLAPADGAAGADDLASPGLEFKLGYGLAAFGDRFTLTAELAASLSDGDRDYRLALRLTRRWLSPFQLAFEAARRETATDPRPQHEAGFTLNAQSERSESVTAER